MWMIKKYLLVFLLVMFFVAVIAILIPKKYMDTKWLTDYAKDVRNNMSSKQNHVKNDLNNIR